MQQGPDSGGDAYNLSRGLARDAHRAGTSRTLGDQSEIQRA